MTLTNAPGRISQIQDFCVFDLETTGVDVDEARIVTAYLGRIDRNNEITGEYEWLVNPGVPIPEGAAAVHGITDEVAATGKPAKEAVAEILAVLRRSIARGRPVVVYNASYDLSLLNAEARRHGLEPFTHWGCVIDPYIIDKQVDRYRKGKRKLEITAAHYGVVLTGAHDARADSLATGGVAWAVLKRVEEIYGDLSLIDFHAKQKAWAKEQGASFTAYKRRTEPDFISDFGWPIRVGDAQLAALVAAGKWPDAA